MIQASLGRGIKIGRSLVWAAFDKSDVSQSLGKMRRQEQAWDDNDRPEGPTNSKPPGITHELSVALLTGGGDRPYAFGLAMAILSRGVILDLIGNDELDCPEFQSRPQVNFLNLRGDQRPNASVVRKVFRVSVYYAKLIRYVTSAKPEIFHILWNNKFEFLDRTLLTLYYKWLRKKIVLTLHNVNAGKRDANDTLVNRLTLRFQYRLADHIFVHTEAMKRELIGDFNVPTSRITVIPFGINNAVRSTDLTSGEAKRRLGIRDYERTILFFGNIAPYKGLEYLVAAFHQVLSRCDDYRLIIAGQPKKCARYWAAILEQIGEDVCRKKVLLRPDFIPDDDTEIYFKAADVFVLPYKHIYQSGVLFLGQTFGLPVVATDVGSLKDDIVEAKTGFMCRPEDPLDLANTIERYFESDVYKELNSRRREIREYGEEHHSWDEVAQITTRVYAALLRLSVPGSSAPVSRSRLDIGHFS